MKHIEIIILIIICGLTAACDATIHFYPEPQPSLVVLQLNVDRNPPLLYKSVTFDSIWQRSERMLSNAPSIEYDIPDDYVMRITVEMHDANLSKGRQTRRADATTLISRRVVYVDRNSAAPQDTLHYHLPDGNYFAVAWADYVPKANPADWHYNTADINEVVFDPGTYPANPHLRSAATGSCEFSVDFSLSPEGYPTTAEAANHPIIDRCVPLFMKRPAGRFRIIASDIDLYRDIIDNCSVTVIYRQFISTGYSPVRHEPTEIIGSYQWSAPLYIESYTLGGCSPTDQSIITDYIFANPTRESRIIADFYFFDPRGNCFNQCIGIEIPIFANRETIVKGNVLTSSPDYKPGDNGVNIDEGFDGEIIVHFSKSLY